MEEIDEYGSSKHCSCCHNVLTNMRAERTTQKKQPDVGLLLRSEAFLQRSCKNTWKISTQKGHVHKILHCRSSTNGLGGHCGASWDRDMNAS
jgi:transposase